MTSELATGYTQVRQALFERVAYDVLVHRVELAQSATRSGIGPGDVLVELLSRVPAALPTRPLS